MNHTLHSLRVLLRARWWMYRNSVWRVSLWRRALYVAQWVFALGLLAGSYVMSLLFITSLQVVAARPASSPASGEIKATSAALLAGLPNLLMLAVLVFGLLVSLGAIASTLFFATDLEFLLATPTPVRAILLSKLGIELAGYYQILLLVVAMPLAAYGVAMGYGAGYWLMALLIFLALPLLPLGLAALLVLVGLRILPLRRLKELASVLSGAIGLVCYMGFMLADRRGMFAAIERSAGSLAGLDWDWLPSAWAGRALVGAGLGQPAALGYGALFASAAALVFVGGAFLTERMYHRSWLIIQSSGQNRRRRPGQPGAPARRQGGPGRQLGGWLGQAQAVVRKDLLVLRRDWWNIGQLLWPLVWFGFWGWRLVTSNDLEVGRPDSQLVALASAVAVGLFIGSSLSSRLAQAAVSREGRSYWLIQIAPVSPRAVLWGKALVAWLPYPILGLLIMVLSMIVGQLAPGFAALGWLLVLICGAGFTCLGTGIGAMFARLDWDQPARMTTARAGCLGALAGWLYGGLCALLLALASAPWSLPLLEAGPGVLAWRWALGAAGASAALGLTALVIWLPIRLGAERMERMEG